ncbi:MAG: hypothetical protein ABR978_05620 [Dehalococcoidia bacterium]|jgi:hypothetical protein
MAEKLFECEWTPEGELVFRLRKPAKHVLNPEIRGHVLEARKEVLMALRSLIDVALERMDEKEKGTGRRRTQIKVE